MERREPTFGRDLGDLELRPRGYRAPSRDHHREADGLAWKIGVAVGVGVLAALLIFNAFERYQARRDAAQAVEAFNREVAKLDRELSGAIQQTTARSTRAQVRIKPVPPGYRCVGGALLYREGSSWTQITARSNHVHCPRGGSVDDCYLVTPRSVGCVSR